MSLHKKPPENSRFPAVFMQSRGFSPANVGPSLELVQQRERHHMRISEDAGLSWLSNLRRSQICVGLAPEFFRSAELLLCGGGISLMFGN